MIEFSCMYCGQPVRVGEEPVRKRMECPGCGHSIPVRARKPGEALQAANARSPAPTEAEGWAGKSDEEIVEQLLSPTLTKAQQRQRVARMLLSPLLPQYDDLTLFALSLAFLLLGLIDAKLRQDLAAAYAWQSGGRLPVLVLVAAFGMVCSLINVFLHREKSDFEKRAMLLFAVFVTAGTGIYAGWLMLRHRRGWLLVFPAWNIFNGGLLLALARFGVIDTDCITDEEATFAQVLVTAVAVPILLTVCYYLFELHWAVTFSVTVAYAMSLHKGLRSLFGRRKPALTTRPRCE